jgi:hypothetical protein
VKRYNDFLSPGSYSWQKTTDTFGFISLEFITVLQVYWKTPCLKRNMENNQGIESCIIDLRLVAHSHTGIETHIGLQV